MSTKIKLFKDLNKEEAERMAIAITSHVTNNYQVQEMVQKLWENETTHRVAQTMIAMRLQLSVLIDACWKRYEELSLEEEEPEKDHDGKGTTDEDLYSTKE